jgi:hypothetical protein
VEPSVFDEDTFKEEHAVIDPVTKRARYRCDTIRWRRGGGDESQLESNTRLVVFSDGSKVIYVGGSAYLVEEVKEPSHLVYAEGPEDARDREDAEGSLPVFREVGRTGYRYTVKAVSKDTGDAQIKDISRSLADRLKASAKETGSISYIAVAEDEVYGEGAAAERGIASAKKKAAAKRARQQRQVPMGLSRAYLEDDDDEAVDIGAIRKGDFSSTRPKRETAKEREERDTAAERRLMGVKAATGDDSEEVFEQGSEDDEDNLRRKKKTKVVISDDDDDDEDVKGDDDDE